MRATIGILIVVVAILVAACEDGNGEEIVELQQQVVDLQQQLEVLSANDIADPELEDRLTELEETMRKHHPRGPGQPGTFAHSIDPWGAYLSGMENAELALDNGEVEVAKALALETLTDLDLFCSSRVLPVWAVREDIQELVSNQIVFEEIPQDEDVITSPYMEVRFVRQGC